MNNFKVKSCKIGGKIYKLIVQNKYDTEDLREFLYRIDYYLDSSKIIKDERNVKVGICEFRNMKIFVKKYNDRGFLHRLKYLFRRMRALNSVIAYDYLKKNVDEILVPEHIAAIWKKGIFASLSYLIAEAINDGVSLHDILRDFKFDEHKMRKLIQCIVQVLVRLHIAGVYHGDAKVSNFCYIEREEQILCGVWDLDSMRIYSYLPYGLRCNDLGNAIGSFYKVCFEKKLSLEKMAQIFCKEYEELSGEAISFKKVLKRAEDFLR